MTYICKLLKCVCFNCSRLLVSKQILQATQGQITDDKSLILRIKNPKLKFGKIFELCNGVSVCNQEHGGCGYKQPRFRKGSLKIEIELRDENYDTTRDRKQNLWPEDTLKVLTRISDEDC